MLCLCSEIEGRSGHVQRPSGSAGDENCSGQEGERMWAGNVDEEVKAEDWGSYLVWQFCSIHLENDSCRWSTAAATALGFCSTSLLFTEFFQHVLVVLARYFEGPLFRRSTVPKVRVKDRVRVSRVTFKVTVSGSRISRVMVSRVSIVRFRVSRVRFSAPLE